MEITGADSNTVLAGFTAKLAPTGPSHSAQSSRPVSALHVQCTGRRSCVIRQLLESFPLRGRKLVGVNVYVSARAELLRKPYSRS